MPTVLLLCEYDSLNGGERSLLAIIDYVRAAGFEYIVAGPPSGDLALQFADRGIPMTPFETHLPNGTRRSQAELRELLWALYKVMFMYVQGDIIDRITGWTG